MLKSFHDIDLNFFIGHSHISGAICEKLHQDQINDNCSIKRMLSMSAWFLNFYLPLNTIIFWSGITFWRGLGHDVFEATLGPIEQYEEFNENDWAPFWLYIATNLFKGTLFLFIKFSIGNFLFSAFLFCFLDPLSI